MTIPPPVNGIQDEAQHPETTSENTEPDQRRRPGATSITLSDAHRQVLAGYLAVLARAPLSAETVRTYTSKVRQYLAWLAIADRDPGRVEPRVGLQKVLHRRRIGEHAGVVRRQVGFLGVPGTGEVDPQRRDTCRGQGGSQPGEQVTVLIPVAQVHGRGWSGDRDRLPFLPGQGPVVKVAVR